MSHTKNRRPGWETGAATKWSKNTSYGKASVSTATLFAILWIQNSLVLLSLLFALAVTR